ncbi:hypothetical protein CHLRE_14g624125v5 [Chlamydomonas reinhardtii]|uniref:Uncharacterized protein n=1 Tax=Chlamydomonas reinhardtii TaxID=3055 RepID=A0A2K3CY69_CHLRE|nr:uncharacterized protein CHLRE_14g624125v5 [Chlamydomonas reinhardtii]XP_042916922.1 uncharacterized protein CHLRE_14g624125v5 [Chlamydomonas reinhardtii]PNW73234.1 hypothetical protein CHLRE_14g624125v5 [Chlamydomonas reinhardtii]PNW73235.1 hypothetical protein CHLRE_14g624125v5 [Chlamydomonas reinhardtii]
MPVKVQAVRYRGEASTPYLWTARLLSTQMDGPVFRQYQLRHSAYLQCNKALCDGAILA